MKNNIVTSIAITIFLFSGLKAQEKAKIDSIHKVVVSSGILLQIEIAPEYSLSLTTQDLEAKCLIQEIDQGVLTLKIFNGFGCRGKVLATLTCPEISSLEIMGKAEVSTKNLIQSDSLSVILQSGGKAYIDLDVKYLKVSGNGGATFYAEGYADQQDIYVTASSSFSGYKLEGEYVKVEASVSGMAKVCATEKLEIVAGRNTFIGYACEPKKVITDAKSGARIEVASEGN